MSYLMGIDMGGTVVKAAIFDLDGNEIAVHGEKLNILYPGHGMTERDPLEAREKTYQSVAGALKKAQLTGGDIAAIGVTGQGNGAYLFDKDGNPAWNGIMSSDTRAKEDIKTWYGNHTFEKVFPITRQQLWSGNVSAIIVWFREHRPDILDKTAYIVTAKDYVRYLLTGEFHTEITEMSGTSCMDLKKREISQEVFRLLGIESCLEKIPAAIGSCEIGGYVTRQCAENTGLKEGTPVVGGLFDVSASIVSAGIVEENQMGIVVGSWGINSIIRREPVLDPDLFMEYIYCIPGYYALLEGSSTSASNQEWFIDMCMDRNSSVYAECNRMVEETPYRDTVLFLPFTYGTNVNIDAKAMFVGLQGEHGKGHMLRALYEGVVFCHRMHIERLLRHCEMPQSLKMAGGAARSAVWMQLFSDILGTRVEVSRASELGAMGAALSAGVGIGSFSSMDEAARKWARTKQVYQPDGEKKRYYERKYQVYKSVIEAMDGIWSSLDALKN